MNEKKKVEGCRLKVEQRKWQPTYEDFSKWWTGNGGEGLAAFMQHYCDIEFMRRKFGGGAFRADSALYGALRELREDLFEIIGYYMTKVVGNPPAPPAFDPRKMTLSQIESMCRSRIDARAR